MGQSQFESQTKPFELARQLEIQHDVSGLLALLQPEISVIARRAAATSLANIAKSNTVPHLVQILATEHDPSVVQTLIKILGRIGDDAALPILVQMLKSRDLAACQEAAIALSRYNSETAFDLLLANLALDEDTQSWKIRRFAAEALGRLGDRRAVPSLMQTLYDKHTLVPPAAASALGQIGDRRAVEALKRVRHVTRHQRGAECALCETIATALKQLGNS